MQAALRIVRILWIAVLLALAIFIVLPEIVAVRPQPASPTVFVAITVVAFWIVGLAFFMRRRWILTATSTLSSDPKNANALARWRTGYIICLALSESIGLYGLVLRFVGFSLSHVAPFYVVAAVLLFYFRPQIPTDQLV